MPEKLKPCPFCGAEAIPKSCDSTGAIWSEVGTAVLFGKKLDHYLIQCQKCGIRTKSYKTRKGVFNAWNRRAESDL